MPETAFAAADLVLISFLRAILDPCMLRWMGILSWSLLLLATLAQFSL
jgi:hypothetical protein